MASVCIDLAQVSKCHPLSRFDFYKNEFIRWPNSVILDGIGEACLLVKHSETY